MKRTETAPLDHHIVTNPAECSLPGHCTVGPDTELAVAHAVPHLVVSQVHRPDVAAFLESDKINVKTVRDAQCCVTAITVDKSVEHDVMTFAAKLPHLTSLTTRNLKESPSPSVLAALSPQLRKLEWLFCANVDAYAVSFSEALAKLPVLTRLDLSGSIETGSELSTILADARTKLPKLRQLELRWSSTIEAAALAEIATLPALEVLDLSYSSSIDADGFEHLAENAHRLRVLNMNSCAPLNCRVLARHLSAIRSLRTLLLSGSFISAFDVQGHLSKLDELEVLDLDGCPHVETNCLGFVAKMTGLREIDLSRCDSVNEYGIEHIATLPRLRKLGLYQCKNIDAECLRHLSNVATLEELELSYCRDVDAEGLMHLSKLPRLRELALYECSGVDGQAIIDHLVAMPSLRVLKADSSAVDNDRVRSCLPKSLRVVI